MHTVTHQSSQAPDRALKFNVDPGNPWIRCFVLMLAMVVIHGIEQSRASGSLLPILKSDALPFLLGMVTLPLRQEAILAVGLVGMAATSAHLTPGMGSEEAIARVALQAVAVGFCLWMCRRQTQLDHNKTDLESIISSAPVGLAVCNSNSRRILMSNAAMATLLRIPQQQLIGRHWDSIGYPLPAPNQRRRHRLRGLADELVVELSTTAVAPISKKEDLWLIYAHEIGQQIMNEETLVQQHEQLQQSLQACLKGVSLVHELRQPLALLLLQCRELIHLQEQSTSHDAALNQGLLLLQDTAQQIDATMVTMSGLLRSANRSSHQTVNLTALLGNLIADVRNQLECHGVELSCQGLERPVRVDGDQSQLRIAFGNLLRNALEALKEQPMSQRRLLIKLESQPTEAILTIADSGPGLPSLDLDGLQLRSTKTDGLGLGLFTTAMVARHHDGQLILGGCPHLGGAEIRLSLPRLAAKPRANND